MNHIVYLSKETSELEKLLTDQASALLRGADQPQPPFGSVQTGDTLYLIDTRIGERVQLSAQVAWILQSEGLNPERARRLLLGHRAELGLSPEELEMWCGCACLTLVGLDHLMVVDPFYSDQHEHSRQASWLPVDEVRLAR